MKALKQVITCGLFILFLFLFSRLLEQVSETPDRRKCMQCFFAVSERREPSRVHGYSAEHGVLVVGDNVAVHVFEKVKTLKRLHFQHNYNGQVRQLTRNTSTLQFPHLFNGKAVIR